ncbi:MAG: hypothetical protein INF44_04260 [Thalassospira sp.]|nr:hypothetical protein [Thalassospira sp.]
MTKDDVISIAREVWGDGSSKPWSESALLHLERFGELLEAKVRADEREAVIKATIDQGFVGQAYADDFAAAIRARGEK